MFRVQQLQQERNHKALTMKDIIDRAERDGNRTLTAEETKLFDTIQSDIETLDTQITACQETEKRRQQLQGTIDRLNSPAPRIATLDKPATPAAANGSDWKVPATARSVSKLKAFKGAEAHRNAYRAGMWLRGALFNDQRAAIWCASNGVGNVQLDNSGLIRNAMSTTSNPDGGFLVPDEMSEAIIDLREEYGVARANMRVWPMGSDTLLIPRRSGGITIAAIGENPTSISQSTPTFNLVTLVAKKCGGLSLLSTEIAADAVIDLADWVAQEFAYAFALFEDQCAFIGDGTSTYMGIRGLGNLFTTTGGVGGAQLVGAVDAATNHDTFAEIDNADLTTMMGKLPAYARMNAAFYCSAVAADVVFTRLSAVAGGNNTQTLREGLGLSYLGYPIRISQVMPTSTGDLSDLPMLYFGDMRLAGALGDRRSVMVFPSEHAYMATDQIAIRGTERFDVVWNDVGDTTTGNAGPIVALVGE